MAERPPARRRTAATRAGEVTYRESGRELGRDPGGGATLLLLHGIGSGSGSWAAQLAAFGGGRRVVAWDAPGYGGSARLPMPAPAAADFAAALAGLLDAVGVGRCDLVGHSLGALMACAFARLHPGRVRSLMLASPAAGYGRAGRGVQAARRSARLGLLDRLGPEGMARERHGALLSAGAPPGAREAVRAEMARIRPDGYRQAVETLVNGDIHADARGVALAATVVVGAEDRVTPPDACRQVAESLRGARFETLEGLGHACYVEGPEAFNAALERHLERHLERAPPAPG